MGGRSSFRRINYDLQQQIDAAHYQSTIGPVAVWKWFAQHFPPGGSGDPQRQAGPSGGFDPRFTDAGNYGYGLSAAAGGLSLESAFKNAALVNNLGMGKALPSANARASEQGYNDYVAKHFPNADVKAGQDYVDRTSASDIKNAMQLGGKALGDTLNGLVSAPANAITKLFGSQPALNDAQRYAQKKFGNLDSPEAQAFVDNFKQAFGGYLQHVDLDKLQPLAADGTIPSGKDVSLFVGKNGEVLVYVRDPAPGGSGPFRGIFGLDGAPNGQGGTGLSFFQDGTPQPSLVQQHLATPGESTGGIDVTLPNATREHWWNDPIDGFLRAPIDASPQTPSGGGVINAPNQGKRSDLPGGALPDVAQAAPINLAFASAGSGGVGGVLKYFDAAPPGTAEDLSTADANALASPVLDVASEDSMPGPRLARRVVDIAIPSAPDGLRPKIPDDITLAPGRTVDDTKPVRRLVNLSAPPVTNTPPLAPAVSPPLLGIVSGRPMRDDPVRPSIFQTNDESSNGYSANDVDELIQRWRRWADA